MTLFFKITLFERLGGVRFETFRVPKEREEGLEREKERERMAEKGKKIR